MVNVLLGPRRKPTRHVFGRSCHTELRDANAPGGRVRRRVTEAGHFVGVVVVLWLLPNQCGGVLCGVPAPSQAGPANMLAQPPAAHDATALTSILTTTLEARGALGKIRAELRASVFTAIHEQQSAAPGHCLPPAVAALHQDGAGRLAVQLVLELLATCQLDYSLSVLGAEANLKGAVPDREMLVSALGLPAGGSKEPLLVQLVRAAQPRGGERPAERPASAAAAISANPATTAAAAAPPPPATVAAVTASGAAAAAVEPSAASSTLLAAQPIGKDAPAPARYPPPPPSSSGDTSPKQDNAMPLRAAGPPSPPSPASPLLSVLPPLGKPKGPGGGGFLADLPPLCGRGATVPPLAGMASMPATATVSGAATGGAACAGAGGGGGASCGTGGGGTGGGGAGGGGGASLAAGSAAFAPSASDTEERRLDALENRLSTLAGLPLRPAAAGSSPQLAPLGGAASRLPSSSGVAPSLAGGGGSVGRLGDGGTPLTSGGDAPGGMHLEAQDEPDEIEEDMMEEVRSTELRRARGRERRRARGREWRLRRLRSRARAAHAVRAAV
jgi:hypothetical protein